MSDCGACGCPEVECLDMHTLALAAGERDECCRDCAHVWCPYCVVGLTEKCMTHGPAASESSARVGSSTTTVSKGN